jgi:hypothetical protein
MAAGRPGGELGQEVEGATADLAGFGLKLKTARSEEGRRVR